MTALDLVAPDAVLVVSAPRPTQLVAALDPPLMLEVAPQGATLDVVAVRAGMLTAPAAQGPMGVPGPQGPQGPAGVSGASFVFDQSQPSVTWVVAHGLGRYPSVTIVDTAGDVMDTTTTYLDADRVLVTFTAPVAGSAYIN